MSYFIPGLWHFAAALSWAVALGTLGNGDALFWLRQPAFSVALLLGSSALFFVPDAWAKKGLLKFLHYPLPDWDVLFLGPASHRNWFTHSPILPVLAVALAWKFPFLLQTDFTRAAAGLGVGIGSHLFWDCVGSRTHRIIVVPYWYSMRAAMSRFWLLSGAAICLVAAARFGVMPQLERLLDFPAPPQTEIAAIAPLLNIPIKPRLLATGIEFGEGPSLAWNDQLLCVDMRANRIAAIDTTKPGAGATTWLDTLQDKAKSTPNGSKFHNGVLYLCDSGRQQMLAINQKKEIRVIAHSPNGPNDCAFDANGDFFFSDPNYDKQKASVYWCRGSRSQGSQSTVEFERTWETVEFATGFEFPNGVVVGRDGAIYIAETKHNRIWRYERRGDGSAGEGKVWCDLPRGDEGSFFGPDGIVFDKKGRLFVAHFGVGKIEVISADGKTVLARLDASGQNPTNLCFSRDGAILYVTEIETRAIYSLDISNI